MTIVSHFNPKMLKKQKKVYTEKEYWDGLVPDDEFEEMSKVGTPPAELDPIVPTTELSFRTSKIVPSSDALFKNATV